MSTNGSPHTATEDAPHRPALPRRFVLWTRLQLGFALTVAVVLLGTAFFMVIINADYASLLWQTPLGIKMTVGAIVLSILGYVLYLGTCPLINWAFPPGDQERYLARLIASGTLGVVVLLFFFLPALSVLVTGPATIRIQDKLTAPPS